MKRIDISEAVFKIVAYVLVILFALACLYPFIYTLSVSISSQQDYLSGIYFLPKGSVQFEAFNEVLKDKDFWAGYSNTIFYTFYGTLFSMVITIAAAYALAKRNIALKKALNLMIVFTMWFSAGLIPTYQNYMALGVDNRWGIIIGFGAQAFNIILLRNYFSGISSEIEEAATVDGANDLQILTKVYLPMSTSALATVTLFYALNRWNGYFWADRLLNSKGIQKPLQTIIKNYNPAAIWGDQDFSDLAYHPDSLKYVMILLSIIPILLVYPYIQKYFAKGVNVGGVKE